MSDGLGPLVDGPVEPTVGRHTSGPWSVFQWSGHHAISSDDSAAGFGIEAAGYRLPLCDLDGDIDEAAANARLIAAAPDLLAALQACRGQWIHSVNAEQCLAALRKATGDA